MSKLTKAGIGCCELCYAEVKKWQRDDFWYPTGFVCMRHSQMNIFELVKHRIIKYINKITL